MAIEFAGFSCSVHLREQRFHMDDIERKMEIIDRQLTDFLAGTARRQSAIMAGLADRPAKGRKKAARDAIVEQLKATKELRSLVASLRNATIVGSEVPADLPPAPVDHRTPMERALERLMWIAALKDGWLDGEGRAISPKAVLAATTGLHVLAPLLEEIGIFPTEEGLVQFEFLTRDADFSVVFHGSDVVEVWGLRDNGKDIEPHFRNLNSKAFRKLLKLDAPSPVKKS